MSNSLVGPTGHENPGRRLAASLGEVLETAPLTRLVEELIASRRADTVWELLQELEEASPKAARAAIEALPELSTRIGLAHVVPWLDLGVAVATASGASALKYFRESPTLLSLLPAESQPPVLRAALEAAEQDHTIALECIRKAPELLSAVPDVDLEAWGSMGVELARTDGVVAIEFLRNSPAAAAVLPWDALRPWSAFGSKLIAQNSLGKTDYLGTVEFFRTSPAILGDMDGLSVRQWAITLGSTLAERSPQAAIEWLAAAPTLLRRVSSEAMRLRLLQYGLLVAERDVDAASAYLRRAPEILALLGEDTPTRPSPPAYPSPLEGEGKGGGGGFDKWFRAGMEVLELSVEGGRAYFSLETRKALASVEEALAGVPLRQVARSLKLFAEALCGTDVRIQSLPEGAASEGRTARAAVSADGRTIALPAILRCYPTRVENERLYTVMTAHEAGHLEFGTYRLSLPRLADLMEDVHRRYGLTPSAPGGAESLADLFRLYPQPGLIRDLWTLLEDARVEWLLRLYYPGLRDPLAALAREAAENRPPLHSLTARELVVDCLLRVSSVGFDAVALPRAVAGEVESIWAECRTILRHDATAEDAVRMADRAYLLIERAVAGRQSDQETTEDNPDEAQRADRGSDASAERSNHYRPVTNWDYRGAMDPALVTGRRGDGASEAGASPQTPCGVALDQPAAAPTGESSRRGSERIERDDSSGQRDAASVRPDSLADRVLAVRDDRIPRSDATPGTERVFTYDEWDGLVQDYRTGWCRVVERVVAEQAPEFAEEVLARHGAAVRLLRRSFESLRPPGLRTVRGELDGDALDWDALIRRRADEAAGVEPSDRIYVRREKRERDVAAAFLVDLSGSTSRRVGAEGRQVIEVEKESLVLLCEALDALGDHYAVYGYSGRGRGEVDFVIVKDFDESRRARALSRIGALSPLHQNRDGAAIRHAAWKLRRQEAAVKLLVVINDGRPLDDGYADEYALEDTKMALREARQRGIHAFCLTVDREADDYVRRMYGDVRFLVLDHVAALPERLPRMYQRLTT